MNIDLPTGPKQLVQAKVQSDWIMFSERGITAARRLRWPPGPVLTIIGAFA
jgi:hypothetical protein